LAKTVRDSFLLTDGINAITITSDTTNLKISFAINPPMKVAKSERARSVQYRARLLRG
jgi:hypothetical protein